jgi:hypothetical protein
MQSVRPKNATGGRGGAASCISHSNFVQCLGSCEHTGQVNKQLLGAGSVICQRERRTLFRCAASAHSS